MSPRIRKLIGTFAMFALVIVWLPTVAYVFGLAIVGVTNGLEHVALSLSPLVQFE